MPACGEHGRSDSEKQGNTNIVIYQAKTNKYQNGKSNEWGLLWEVVTDRLGSIESGRDWLYEKQERNQ